MKQSAWIVPIFFSLALVLAAAAPRQAVNPNPPEQPVKLIFIHHSTGGNWLADPAQNELGGDLGRALMENNYFVSATNYGWGPDSIGDATDIPNWLDWFASENTPRYMDALYNEDGQNFGDFGSWPRLANDPGGENEIIVFKSCFPNSELEGRPDDPPDPEGWLSVGHAKYVYNEILQYFATRPDKLFVVIAAPPVQSRTYAKNARAFNNWLVNDWLRENSYLLSNVAVFDFYNVLTGPDAHHRYNNGQIEHIVGSRDTLYYPSGDDHPSAAGNRKATEEFIPLLNIFYHRWQETLALTPFVIQSPQPSVTDLPTTNIQFNPSLIDDFDGGAPADTVGWDAYWGETFPTRLSCAPANDTAHGGTYALKLDFDVSSGSWATCVLSHNDLRDWSAAQGLAFYLHADHSGLPFDVILYAGSSESQESYLANTESTAESTDGWIYVSLPWSDFQRVEWEENAGAAFEIPDRILGMAFGLNGLESASNTGTLWVDDIALFGAETVVDQPLVTPPEEEGGGSLPCLGALILPLAFFGLAWLLRRR